MACASIDFKALELRRYEFNESGKPICIRLKRVQDETGRLQDFNRKVVELRKVLLLDRSGELRFPPQQSANHLLELFGYLAAHFQLFDPPIPHGSCLII